MQKNFFTLYIELNRSNYIFSIVEHDDNYNFKILGKKIASNDGVDQNKITNIVEATESIKKNIVELEKKFDLIFNEVNVILDIFNYSCTNVSGYKKLNQSQVLKENISYILNSLKLIISENEKNKTILHIFNSKNILDKTIIENLPIGLFGDFYSHELTFFSIDNNDLKNINQIFKKNNINVKKVLLKNFIEGVSLINKNKNIETFFKVKIGRNISSINFFNKSSFRYAENFKFGSNIILKDIKKICAISDQSVDKILSDKVLKKKDFDENELLEDKYFINDNYRKIRKKLIYDIAQARIKEIVDIILDKNINLKHLIEKESKIYISVEDKSSADNFADIFIDNLSSINNLKIEFINDLETNELIMNAAKVSLFGWKKEAIPIAQTKKSLITRIFKSIFE